jgi:riboflavin transporter 2
MVFCFLRLNYSCSFSQLFDILYNIGMFVELPLMVHDLPERWRLPAILTLAMQVAQVGPLIFIIMKFACPKRISYTITIYATLIIGIVSCFLLFFFWNKVVLINGEKRSIPLYVLIFSLGLLGS